MLKTFVLCLAVLLAACGAKPSPEPFPAPASTASSEIRRLPHPAVEALDTPSPFLKTTQSQRESTPTPLNTELNSIENIDQVEAILTLVSAQTSYNAALQVGANVVPQSLMDYLN